jgi:hypothetical protein
MVLPVLLSPDAPRMVLPFVMLRRSHRERCYLHSLHRAHRCTMLSWSGSTKPAAPRTVLPGS